jgi:hypothetical protein
MDLTGLGFVGHGHELDITSNTNWRIWTSKLDRPVSTGPRHTITRRARPCRSPLRKKKEPFEIHPCPPIPRASSVAGNPSAAALYPCLLAAARSSKLAGRLDVDGETDLPSPTMPLSPIPSSQRRRKRSLAAATSSSRPLRRRLHPTPTSLSAACRPWCLPLLLAQGDLPFPLPLSLSRWPLVLDLFFVYRGM